MDTDSAIRRGVLTMQAAAVDRLFAGAADPPPNAGAAVPVLTGGAAGLIRGLLNTPGVRFDPHLTLRGLAIAAGSGA